MKYSEQMDKIAQAMLAVQKELEPLHKNAKNDHFGNEYLTLDGLLAYALPLLTANDLVLTQGGGETTRQGGIMVETMLIHAPSGQWVKSEFDLPMQKQDPQGAGSAITYGKRYGLAAILGVSTEADDDAEASVKAQRARDSQPRQAPQQVQGVRTVAEATGHAPQKGKLDNVVACPKCGSDMWDNRLNKKNPRAPDFKCKDKTCDGVIWPQKEGKQQARQSAPPRQEGPPEYYDLQEPQDDLDLPF